MSTDRVTGPAGARGGWRAEARRERRAHLAQIAIVLVAGALAITLIAVFGRAMTGVGRARDEHSAALDRLVAMRDVMRIRQADFWEARADGADPIATVKAAALLGRDAVAALAAQHPDRDGGAAKAEAVAATQGLYRLIADRAPDTVVGSSADKAEVDRANAYVDRIQRALGAWIRAERGQVAVATRDARALSRDLLLTLGLLLFAVVVAAVVAFVILARSRRRLLAEHVRNRDERGALLTALQDGLIAFDSEGRIEDVNRTFTRMTGLPRSAVVGTGPPFPFWPATSEDEGGVRSFATLLDAAGGDFDAVYRRDDGSRFDAVVSIAPRFTPDGGLDGHVATIKDVTERRRAEADLGSVAAEQAALRRVATAVAASDDPVAAFALGAREAARLLDVDRGVVVRFDAGGPAVVGRAGRWPDDVAAWLPDVGSGAAVRRVDPLAGAATRPDARWVVAAPIMGDGAPWGALAVAGGRGEPPVGATHRVGLIAGVLALAVANADARGRLAALADGDPVTGLANHRAFHERLADEVERARRHGRALSVAVLDIDLFKDVNDTHGHQMGDRVLAEMARRLREAARPGDILARVGGEEFALVMPETEVEAARDAVERIRTAVAAAPFAGVGRLTMSAGVCDLARASDAEDLVRLADGALYWAKAHGRDAVYAYEPDVVQELSVGERAARLERDHLLAGLRGLARAVDAKDRSTRQHSERVALLAGEIAATMGWAEDDVAQLREAALLHDVGKIGVPDEILFKRSALTPEERRAVMDHATLGAEMVEDILNADQADWIRRHHERVDGRGYPGGLDGRRIPAGALVLAVADAWDVMTSARPYAAPIDAEAALAECRRGAGTHFDARVVRALEDVVASGRAAEIAAATAGDGTAGAGS